MSLYDVAAEIVLAALDLSGAARSEFVAEKTNGDPALAKEVRSLLEAHERSEAFLETPPALPQPRIGDTVGGYRVLGTLGEGGMGVVYLAEDTRLGRKVAFKAIAPQFTDNTHVRERLRREARAAAALTHPGIAVVHALEEIDGRLYLVAEHIQGETLRDAIANGPLPLGEVLAIGRMLADALANAHDNGVIHRDLKPENVMRTPSGAIKILDFGLARFINAAETAASRLSVAGAVFGTPAYMSPEQLRGESAGAASDIFALGVLLAELSSGKHPFGSAAGTATMAKVLSAEPDLSGVAPPLRPVIAGCVAKLPDDRFRSAHEVRAAIDTVARGETPRAIDHQAEFWWWQFHQAGACVFSAVLMAAVWFSSESLPREQVDYALVGAIIGGAGAVTLRLYNWFTSRMRPTERVPYGVAVGARIGDGILAGGVFVAGFYQRLSHPYAAVFLMSAAVVMTIISTVIEPATARAARR